MVVSLKKYRTGTVKTILMLILMFSMASCLGHSLFASGRRENRLPEARKMVEERRFNDAIHLLSEIMRTDPDHFDEAEALLEEVRAARDQYNRLYARLIEILDPPPGEDIDEEAAYDVITEMEALDSSPNQAAVEAFAEARASIIFAINDRRYQRIMITASEMITQGLYQEVVEHYLSGFDLHRQSFEEAGYGEIAHDQIEHYIARVQEYAELGSNLFQVLETDISVLEALYEAGERAAFINEVQELIIVFEALSRYHGLVYRAAQRIDELRNTIQRPNEVDVPYLSTLRNLTRGRARIDEREGIAGVMDRVWGQALEKLVFTAEKGLQTAFIQASETLDNSAAYDRESISGTFNAPEQRSLGLAALSATEEYADLLADLLQLVPSMMYPAENLALSKYDRELFYTYLPLYLHTQAVKQSLNTYRQLVTLEQSKEELFSRGLGAEEVDSILNTRDELLQIKQQLADIVDMAASEQERYTQLIEHEIIQEGAAIFVEQLRDFQNPVKVYQSLDFLANHEKVRLTDIETDFVERAALLQYGPLEETLELAADDLDQSDSYNQGVEEVLIAGEEAVTVRYPQRSEELLTEAGAGLQVLEQENERILQFLQNEPAYLRQRDEISAQIERGEALAARMEQLQIRQVALLNEARDLNRRASLALAEGELRYIEAEAQLEQQNFEQARQRLEQAGEAFANSLTFREDPAVRELMDEEIPKLAELILFEYNQLVVREVREMITEGRRLFFQENFVRAEQLFNRAQSRWRETNPENSSEIDNWLVRVQRALEATTGVHIAAVDPLFPEMTQLLNLARRYYREGRDAIERGDRETAMTYFARAEQKIEYIKEPFPNNQESSVIYLRILQYTDPEDFDAILQERLNEARAAIRTEPEEAYRELRVLEEIAPNLRGLEQAIYDAELATGIRQPPPDPQKIARARELYQEAQEIFQQDVRARFSIAVTFLDEAIELDPDFNDAILLKDSIQSRIGGGVTVVLSSVDQQRFRQAQDLFIDARYFEASVIVEQLLQDPRNQRNQRLVDLQRRIQSRL